MIVRSLQFTADKLKSTDDIQKLVIDLCQFSVSELKFIVTWHQMTVDWCKIIVDGQDVGSDQLQASARPPKIYAGKLKYFL